LNGLALRLGLHVSIQGELDEAVDRAVQRDCNTMQMFTRNPRGWGYRPFDEGVVACFKEKLADSGISPVFAHMPYLPNLASPRSEVYERSVETLRVELDRCALLGVPYLVTHLGSSLGAGKEAGLKRIIDAIEVAVGGSKGAAMILLENTAGSSNSMGSTFEEIRRVIDGVGQRSRIGVCLDTCHAFAAGYDLATSDGLKNVLRRFDDVLGWERLRLVHLNDSKGGLRSRWDRHEHIGLGRIGKTGIMNLLASSLGRLPLILETPIDERRDDVGNLREVRGLATMALGG
jgi:deoxyribonuclease-4